MAQADDIALIALTPLDLQKQIDICIRYSQKWRYCFNAAKTCIIVFGETLRDYNRNKKCRHWFLNIMEISQVREARHVGVTLDASLKMSKRCCEASQKGKGSFMALAGRGVRPNGLNPITCCNLLRLIVLPRALYGCELWWKLTKSDILVLERMLRFCVKHIQWFSGNAQSCGNYGQNEIAVCMEVT